MKMRGSRNNVKPTLATHFMSVVSDQDQNLNVSMFIEDLHLSIMPIGGWKDNQKNFEVKLEGEDTECEKAKIIIGKLCGSNGHDLFRMLCDTVGKITKYLAWKGEVFYEIVKDNEEIYIFFITPKNLFRIFSWYFQIIPRKDWKLWERKYTLINKKRVWSIHIPRYFGGRKEYKKMLQKLKKYNSLGPEFYGEDLKHGILPREFELSRYVGSSDIYTNRAIRKWGWNRRDSSQTYCTEFYIFYKILNFRRAQAILREHIINEINELFAKLSIGCKIIVTGLPTADEILQVEKDMQSGKIDFSEAVDQTTL